MKLRLRGNSVRLRLQRSEVSALLEHGRVEEHTRFGPIVRLTYRLEVSDSADRMGADWRDGCLSVHLPRALAKAWSEGEELGLEATQPIADNEVLRILVEKDLECLTSHSGEDNRDAYPNPGKHC
ncbi:MAG: hypothetical protein ABIP39_04045 [Polyangiaceae bacterium]